MSLVIPMLRPILVPVVGQRGAVARYVTDLKAAGGMYYSVPRTVIPAGADFEWEFELAPNANSFYIFGDSISSSPRNRLVLSGSNQWYGIEFNAAPSSNTTWTSDGKVHTLKITRTGTLVKLSIDGVLDASTNSASGELSFDGFGNQFGGVTSTPTFSGPFFNSKLTVSSNTELNHDYRFNDNDGVLVDYSGNNANGSSVNVTAADRELMTFDVTRNAWLGQELVTQQVWENPASFGNVWSFANNEWTMTGDGTFSALTLLPLASIPNAGIIQGEVLAMDGSNSLVATQNNGVFITSVGVYERDFNIATHGQYQYKRGVGVMNVTISKPSFKRIIKVSQ